MIENEQLEIDRLASIYGSRDAHVEGHRIRPVAVGDDELELSLLMRFGGDEGTFYLRATSDFSGSGSHHVTIRRSEGDVLEEFETGWTDADADDEFDAVQEMCETYLNSAADWYGFAVGAERAGDGR